METRINNARVARPKKMKKKRRDLGRLRWVWRVRTVDLRFCQIWFKKNKSGTKGRVCWAVVSLTSHARRARCNHVLQWLVHSLSNLHEQPQLGFSLITLSLKTLIIYPGGRTMFIVNRVLSVAVPLSQFLHGTVSDTSSCAVLSISGILLNDVTIDY